MKKIILVVMVLLGATICNAQTQKTKPVKPVPGQTPPQALPKKPAPQMANSTVTDSTKNKVDTTKSKIKPRFPSLGIEKEQPPIYIRIKDTIRNHQ